MKIRESRKKLREACDFFVKKGGTIISHNFFDGDKKCCPMSILVKSKPDKVGEVVTKASKKLECDKMFIIAFIGGFDNRQNVFAKKYHRAFNLGAEFRERYIKRTK